MSNIILKYIKRSRTFGDFKNLFSRCLLSSRNKSNFSFGLSKKFAFLLLPFSFAWILIKQIFFLPNYILNNNGIINYAISKEYARYKFITLIILIALGLLCGFFSGKKNTVRKEYIARITINDIITDDINGYGGINFYNKVIREAIENKNIKAVIISINSGGGQITASEILYKNLLKLAVIKPTFCDIGSAGASGAYMAALACKKIYSKETSSLGSIGVRANLYEINDLATKLGIKLNVITSGDLKASGDPWKKMTSEEFEYINNAIKKAHEFFIKLVAKERNLSIESVKKIANGSVFFGEDAKNFGLIDEIGDEDLILKDIINTYNFDNQIKVQDLSMVVDEEGSLIRKIINVGFSAFVDSVKKETTIKQSSIFSAT